MTKEEITKVLARVRTWPEERQELAALMLQEIEEQTNSPYELTDEQVAEVERRRANEKVNLVSFAEARRRFHQV